VFIVLVYNLESWYGGVRLEI